MLVLHQRLLVQGALGFEADHAFYPGMVWQESIAEQFHVIICYLTTILIVPCIALILIPPAIALR